MHITIQVKTAGTLSDLISEREKHEITELTVTGNLDDADMGYIREIGGRKLSILDLSGANIADEKFISFTFSHCKNLTDVTLPNNATYIWAWAFDDCSSLKNITIPDSVTSIRNCAFKGCSSLTNITIPNSITSFDYCSFSGCTGLTSITIPKSVTDIGGESFNKCSSLREIIVSEDNTNFSAIDGVLFSKDKTTLISYPEAKSGITYIIPSSVTSIKKMAFNNYTSLTSITIPKNFKTIKDRALDGCSNLKEFIVSEENTNFSAIDGVLFNKDKTTLICYPKAKSGVVYKVPDNVTNIRERAFVNCKNLTSIIIPNSVTSIEYSAFKDCSNLKSITIPNSVTSIEYHVFSGCSNLTNIIIPKSVTSIKEKAFHDCRSLTSITIPDSVTSFGNSAFEGCSKLTSITIPDNVTSIGDNAFYGCSKLTSINIPNNIISIKHSAFSYCQNITSITIPNCATAIEKLNFNTFSVLKEFIVPEDNSNFSAIDGILFNKDKTTLIRYPKAKPDEAYIIPNSVVTIGDKTFWNCENLTSITIPNNVTSFGRSAFSGCSNLTSIIIPNSVTSIKNYTFGWCESLTSITIPNSVTSIGDSAFYGCSSLASIIIPDSVTSLGKSAFKGCPNITSLTIPNSITSIGEKGFYDCKNLISITIPNSVTSIGDSAFMNCSGLTSITIPNSVTSIEAKAFEGCENLISITIPNSVTSIGESAFENCSGLTSIAIPNGVTAIGYRAFMECTNLTSITTLKSVTFVECDTFFDCSSLKKTLIPNDIEAIEDEAFYGCENLTSITLPDSVFSIEKMAFKGCKSLTEFIISEENENFSVIDGILFNKDKTILICYPTAKSDVVIIPDSVTAIECEDFSGIKEFIVSKENANFSAINGVLFNKDKTTLIRYPSANPRTAYIIPNSVTTIKDEAFENNKNLTIITIPNSVTAIGDWTFGGCSSLTVIRSNSVIPIAATGSDFYYFGDNLRKLYVPKGSFNAYKNAKVWRNFETILEEDKTPRTINVVTAGTLHTLINENDQYRITNLIITGYINDSDIRFLCIMAGRSFDPYDSSKCGILSVLDLSGANIENNTLKDNAFCYCSSLISITVPNSITCIEDRVFAFCPCLTEITLPNSVTYIGDCAFENCSDLTNITIHNNITYFGVYAFNGCNSLTEITILNGTTGVESEVSCNCDNTATSGDTTVIGFEAFSECVGLEKFIIPEDNELFSTIDGVLFNKDKTALISFPRAKPDTSFVIPDSVTSIEDGAFDNCSKLTDITIHNSITSIGKWAFYECTGIKEIHNNNPIPQKITDYCFCKVNKEACKLYVPKGSYEAYKNAERWRDFENIIEE